MISVKQKLKRRSAFADDLTDTSKKAVKRMRYEYVYIHIYISIRNIYFYTSKELLKM